jgi:CHAT domain-containing protein
MPRCDDREKIQLLFQDGPMSVDEIAGIQMHCDLAVLSACNSGDGKLENNEGILSLGRAFSMSGCQSLIISNGSVIDNASPIVFKDFYKNLKEGDSKDVALQKALLNYRKDGGSAARLPYRWANFHHYGNTDTIEGSADSSFYTHKIWWLLAALATAGLVFWGFKK